MLAFWLSSTKLAKDRHLLHALTEDDDGDFDDDDTFKGCKDGATDGGGWKPVSIFETFNRVRTTGATRADISAALRRLIDPSNCAPGQTRTSACMAAWARFACMCTRCYRTGSRARCC